MELSRLSCVLGMSLLAGAVRLAGQAAPPAPPATAEIFQQARAAIGDVPMILAPNLWEYLAEAEQRGGPSGASFADHAIADYRTAFRAARELRPPGDDAALAERIGSYKARVEFSAVNGVLNLGEFDGALELARSADVPRAPMYESLIRAGIDQAEQICVQQVAAQAGRGGGGAAAPAAAARGGRGADRSTMDGCLEMVRGGRAELGPGEDKAATIRQKPEYDPLALARECFAADGSFPYNAVWVAAQAPSNDGSERMGMLREILARAAADAAPPTTLVSLLTNIHSMTPQLDDVLMDTLTAALKNVQAEVAKLPIDATGTAETRVGRSLLSLMGQLDATRAAELETQMPEFAPNPAVRAPVAATAGRGAAATPDPNAMLASADAMPSATVQQALGRFQSLVTTARSLAGRAPAQAQQAATEAQAMVNDALLEAAPNPSAFLLLATAENALGMPAQARIVLQRCLAVADADAVAFDQQWPTLTADQQSDSFGANLGASGTKVAQTFNTAIDIDYAAAVAAAMQSRAVILKPR